MEISQIMYVLAIAFAVFVIGYVFWAFVGKKFFSLIKEKKKLSGAREFLRMLDVDFPPTKTISKEDREERERKIANSGYSSFTITKAQQLNMRAITKAQQLNTREKNKNVKRRIKRRRTPKREGDNNGRSGTGDTEIERKRILPTPDAPTPERTEQPSKWDWPSVSKDR